MSRVHHHRRQHHRYHAPRRALAGIDEVRQQIIHQKCQAAFESAGTQLEARRYRVIAALKTRSFYTRQDFEAILFATQDLVHNMSKEMDKLRAEAFTYKDMAREEQLQLIARLGESKIFVDYLNEAKAKDIPIIDAPGFWRWVEKALSEIELAAGVVAYMACIKPVWITVVEYIYRASAAILGLAEKAASVVIDLTKTAVGAVMKIPDAIGMVWTVVKWGGLAAAAFFIVKKAREFRGG